MKIGNLKSSQFIIYLVLSLLVWTYIWIRAWKVQFSIDEAATFFMYIQSGRLFPPHAALDANNHLLNSCLTWIFFKLFGSNPLILRLPNIFSALIYFYFIYRIAILFNSKSIRWVFILLSIGTHFIIEFFGYTRGYGMSLALFSGAIYYLLLCARRIRPAYVAYSLLLLVLGMLSNLNMMLSGLSMVVILSLIIFLQRKELHADAIMRSFIIMMLVSIPTFVFLIRYSFQLRAASAFYYGSGDGFFPVTLKSLAGMISPLPLSLFAIYSLLLVTGLTIHLAIKSLREEKKFIQLLPAWIFLALLCANWIGSTILHYLKGVNYQEDRAAMHLLPLFYGFALFSIDGLFRKPILIGLIALLPLIAIPVFSLTHISLDKSVYGANQQIPVRFFQLIEERSHQSDYPPVVSAYQIKRQPWAFLNYRSGGNVNPLYVSEHPWKYADFIIENDSLPEALRSLYTLKLSDEKTGAELYERKDHPLIKEWQVFELKEPIVSNGVYTNIFQFNTDSITGRSLLLLFDFNIESKAIPFEGVIVTEVFDQNKKNLNYEAIDLDQLRPQWHDAGSHLHHTMVIGDIPVGAKSGLIYLWNKRGVDYTLGTGKITMLTIQ
jgi:hypothetical protein